MYIIKIIIDLCVITLTPVPVQIVYVFIRYTVFIIIFEVFSCVFYCGTELFCSEFYRLAINGALRIYTG